MFFEEKVQPVVSPIGLDPSHPFPRLVNKSLNFIVELDGKDAFGRESGLAIIPAPRSLPRLIRLPDNLCNGGDNLIFLSSIIHEFADEMFPGMKVEGCYQFRITRNADLTFDSEEVEDLARTLRGELHSRKYGAAVRLEVDKRTPEHLIRFLLREFSLDEAHTYRVDGPVNLTRMMALRVIWLTVSSSAGNLLHRECQAGISRKIFLMFCVRKMNCCTTRSSHSHRWLTCCVRRLKTRRCWRSSRRFTGPGLTLISSMRWWMLPVVVKRLRLSSNCGPGLMKSPTCNWRAACKRRVRWWSMVWLILKLTQK